MLNAKKNAILFKTASVQAVIADILPRPGDRILIINSGPGDLAKELVKKYKSTIDIVCVETNRPLLELTKDAVGNKPNVQYQSVHLRKLPFAENSFDIIVSILDIEFSYDKRNYIKGLGRLLKHKGKLVVASFKPVGIMFWFKELDWRLFDKRYHGNVDRKALSKLFKGAGLKFLKSKYYVLLGKQEMLYARATKRG